MMNQSSSTYKTLKSNSLTPASQWWAWKLLSSVWRLNITDHSLFCVFGLFSEFHIRVPLWAQWFLHKHSPDKDLQNEIWARWVRSLLIRRARNHGLHRVRLNFRLLPHWGHRYAIVHLWVWRLNIFVFRCTIDWSKGKNVTLKTIKKKQKHKGRGTVRTVTKTVPNDSFFNFFSPPEGRKSSTI